MELYGKTRENWHMICCIFRILWVFIGSVTTQWNPPAVLPFPLLQDMTKGWTPARFLLIFTRKDFLPSGFRKKKVSCWVHACLRPIIGKFWWWKESPHWEHAEVNSPTLTSNWPLIILPHQIPKTPKGLPVIQLVIQLILQTICTISSLKCGMDRRKMLEKKLFFFLEMLPSQLQSCLPKKKKTPWSAPQEGGFVEGYEALLTPYYWGGGSFGGGQLGFPWYEAKTIIPPFLVSFQILIFLFGVVPLRQYGTLALFAHDFQDPHPSVIRIPRIQAMGFHSPWSYGTPAISWGLGPARGIWGMLGGRAP